MVFVVGVVRFLPLFFKNHVTLVFNLLPDHNAALAAPAPKSHTHKKSLTEVHGK